MVIMERVRKMTVMLVLLMLVFGFVRSDVSKDRQECTNQLIGLSTCLPYVGGSATAPTPDCCTGMKQVLAKSKKCLCILVRDRNDPTLGLKINASLALNLPALCKSPASVGDCPALLHLPPHSPEAQVFEQFDKSLHGNSQASNGSSSSSKSTGSSPSMKSDSGKRKSWLELNVVVGLSLLWFTSVFVIMGI